MMSIISQGKAKRFYPRNVSLFTMEAKEDALLVALQASIDPANHGSWFASFYFIAS